MGDTSGNFMFDHEGGMPHTGANTGRPLVTSCRLELVDRRFMVIGAGEPWPHCSMCHNPDKCPTFPCPCNNGEYPREADYAWPDPSGDPDKCVFLCETHREGVDPGHANTYRIYSNMPRCGEPLIE